MTLVLSTNRFSEPIVLDGADLARYQTLWEADGYRAPSSLGPSQGPLQGDRGAGPPLAGPHSRGVLSPLPPSKATYLKRKYVEEEDIHPPLSSCSHKSFSGFEERAHVLYLSLEKLKFIEDPEVYLRRSVLVNNLLRRVHAEILTQSSWCLPACTLRGPSATHGWLLAPDCPFRKRPRLAGGDCPRFPACCLYRECGDTCRGAPLPLGACGATDAAPPGLGCPHQAELGASAVPLGIGGDQMPAGDIFVRSARLPNVQEKGNHLHIGSDRDGGASCHHEARGVDPALVCRGQFCGDSEAGLRERAPEGEAWRRALRRKEPPPLQGPRLCCSRAGNM